MDDPVSIHWFRQDLRLGDNPALMAAAAHGHVLPIFILDDKNSATHSMGAASRWWLHHSLTALNEKLSGTLRILSGDPGPLLKNLAEKVGATKVVWNRAYEPWRIMRDRLIKSQLREAGYLVETFNGSLLWEPWEILKSDHTPYRVFTPYYRRGCLRAAAPRRPKPLPTMKLVPSDINCGSTALDLLKLLPSKGRNWGMVLAPHWHIGEVGALGRLRDFLNDGLLGYKKGRNIPSQPNVSRLSPFLRWGEISANQVWYAVRDRMEADSRIEDDADHFLSELGWREFSYSLLYHFPDLPTKNLQPRFDAFPWQSDSSALRCWQRGQTGYPIVDAGMRQLWLTGYMHNRLRMVVGSFLVKNLLLHWHHGEAWFWDCLVDADLASNSASWQWIAGCGADAAPYFRIFNPVKQGQKFDPDGSFVRRFIPEIASLPNTYLFSPWEAPETILSAAKIKLGQTYPKPIVNMKTSREAALAAFAALKKVK